jgi:hypothetical protein
VGQARYGATVTVPEIRAENQESTVALFVTWSDQNEGKDKASTRMASELFFNVTFGKEYSVLLHFQKQFLRPFLQI